MGPREVRGKTACLGVHGWPDCPHGQAPEWRSRANWTSYWLTSSLIKAKQKGKKILAANVREAQRNQLGTLLVT